MATLSAYGLSVDAPPGWDGSIYKRRDEGFSNQLATREQRDLHAVDYQPIVHLSTLALPVVRGDMGGGVVSELGPEDVFLVLFEYGAASPDQPLFNRQQGVPWPLTPADFSSSALRTQIPGQVGTQRFFAVNGRAFMLYVVLGSASARFRLVPAVNAALAGVQIG